MRGRSNELDFFNRIFVVKCAGCAQRVMPQELVMRAQTMVFHLPCFVCVACCTQLQKGDQFVIHAGQVLCRADFEKQFFMFPQSGIPGMEHPRLVESTPQEVEPMNSFAYRRGNAERRGRRKAD